MKIKDGAEVRSKSAAFEAVDSVVAFTPC